MFVVCLNIFVCVCVKVGEKVHMNQYGGCATFGRQSFI